MARAVAHIATEERGGEKLVRVSLPGKLNEKQFGVVQDAVIGRIKGLTGCPCMSGVIDVIFLKGFQEVVDVQLPG